jgi:hypothetical protein
VDSKQRNYGGREGEASRVAGWINQTLYSERATRGGARAFARYDDLVADWTKAVAGIGEALDLGVVSTASASQIRAAHEFLNVGLVRSSSDWADLPVPADLRALAERVWESVCRLAPDPAADVAQDLNDLRAEYTRYYALAESVAYSSIAAAARGPAQEQGPMPKTVMRLLGMLSPSRRRMVPARQRARMAHAMRRATRRRT